MQADDTVIMDDMLTDVKVNGERIQRGWLHRVVLVAILLLAIFLDFWHLNRLGYGNGYYAAGVRSMLDNWHNFFFVSLDPGGFITIDKPPLGFWIQVASAKLFGFSGFSLLLPEAIAGVLSVAMIYVLVAHVFGRWAGNIAALMLTVTPLSVATGRNNTIDMLLVLCVLIATWTLYRAIESGRIVWLLMTTLLIGLGFNIKMLQAYLVLPAFGLFFLLGSSRRWSVRILQLALALVVLLVVSFSWIVAVDAVPATQRPYVGSTNDNSELSLAIGYNGLQRLFGRNSHILFSLNSSQQHVPVFVTVDSTTLTSNTALTLPSAVIVPSTAQPNHSQQQEVDPGSGAVGQPGALRLWGPDLSNQISWLLPLAFVSLLALIWRRRWHLPLSRENLALILWGTWMLTMVIFFSIAGFFNIYYMVMLAPAICALAAVALVMMWQDYAARRWQGWLLPLSLLIAAGAQAHFLAYYPELDGVLLPIVVGGCVLAAIVLAIGWFLPQVRPQVFATSDAQSIGGIRGRERFEWWRSGIPPLLCALLILLIAPFMWSSYTVLTQTGVTRTASPGAATSWHTYVNAWARTESIKPRESGGVVKLSRLERYLLSKRAGAKFLLATQSSGLADSIILDTNQPVIAWGGFAGRDPVLSVRQLAQLIDTNAVHYFLLQHAPVGLDHDRRTDIPFPGAAQVGNNELTVWVGAYCKPVPLRLWSTTHSTSSYRASNGEVLFDCSHA